MFGVREGWFQWLSYVFETGEAAEEVAAVRN
jgi:hypothetical protein